MLRRLVSGIMVSLLLIGMLTLAFNVQPAKASGNISIRADGSVDPSTAPISSADNTTYTLTGNISDSVVVQRSNIIIDGDGHAVQGSGSGHGFNLTSISNVTIKNTNINGFSSGVYLYSSNNNSINGNNITENNAHGIYLEQSSNNRLSGNNITNNWCGIRLEDSANNSIYHNNFVNNTDQVYSDNSVNFWDDGYPSGGNYWSDYNGTDLFSGLCQNEPAHSLSMPNVETNPDSATYDQIEPYYDARKAVVTSTQDDFYENTTTWNDCLSMLTEKKIYHTVAIITNRSDWHFAQYWINQGYTEAASHSRTHVRVPYSNYEWQINGSRNDIIGNLTLPGWWRYDEKEYVYAWIEPFGSTDSKVRQWLGDCYYLSDRLVSNGVYDFAGWDSVNELFNRLGYTVEMGSPPWGGDTSVSSLNSKFNSAYNNGKIYHLMTHPASVDWSEGAYADLHTDYISNRKDVWYVPFGLLYLYHFIQDRNSTLGLISVSESGNGENKITHFAVDPTYRQRYGMMYPMTYRFSIPHNWTRRYTYYRYRATDPWTLMPNKTSSDFFNGIIASRFNFTSDKAYISINFCSASNNIYLMIRSTQFPPFAFSSDGLGDTPYVINENNKDHYPLMKPYPWAPHDVGITCVASSKTVVEQGNNVIINVMVFNYGNNTENLNVTLYANTNIIDTLTNIALTSRQSTTITFTWNTTGFVEGNYTISAYVEPVPNETDIMDNRYASGVVTIAMAGDINADGMVDIFDIVIVAASFGSSIGQPDYNPNADLTNDGTIDIFDYVIVAANFGKTNQ